MKHTKRLASLLLALVMVFAMSATAFAAGETGTITVDNPREGQTYTAYKIFDVVYNTDQTAYSYTIAGTSEWFNVVATKNADGTVTSQIPGLTFTKAFSEDTYVVTKGNDFSAPAFAETLKANVAGKTGTPLTVADGKATATGLALGYYFVTSTSGALCNLTTTTPNATIYDKNDVPFEKVDDQEDVEIGQTVNYTITGKVPDTTGFETYTYEITDTMSEGLTFNNDVKVFVDGNEISSNYTYEQVGNGFKLSIDVMKLQASVAKEIKVTYSATVNENAVAVISKNHAELKYSNDPTDGTKTTTTPPDEETVYSSKIVIDKYAAGDESKKLAGATFVLYKEDQSGAKQYYKYNATEKKVEWVADKAQATSKTTDDNGAANFDGLANGTYYLEETKAPDGYNLLDQPVEVVIHGGDTEAELTVTGKVANNTGSQLPATGGMGTTIFYVLGSILVLGAVVLLIVKKRMSTAA